MFKNLLNGLLDFILPNTCLACEAPINGEQKYLCGKCYGSLEKYNEVHPWKAEKISAGIIDNSASVFWFREATAIQQLFHALKYQKIKEAGIMLGEEIGKLIAPACINEFELIIPVPLHKAKYRDRTYNLSEYIAAGIKNILSIEVINDALIRSRFTPTQTRLNRSERRENVSGAFSINPAHKGKISGKNIILTDDVITTGATILECAAELKKAGCGKLWICSAAYAELKINIV